MIPSYLLSACVDRMTVDLCYGCQEAVKRNPETGRWFITMGHPGFNSTANNGAGYASESAARRDLKFYSRARVVRNRQTCCADCGLVGETTGHMTYQYPQDR